METKNVDSEGSSIINPKVENEELFFTQLVGESESVRTQLLSVMGPEEIFRYYDYLVEKQELLADGIIVVEDPEGYSDMLCASLIAIDGYPGLDEHIAEVEAKKQEEQEIADLLRTLDEKQWNKRHPMLKKVKNPDVRSFLRSVFK